MKKQMTGSGLSYAVQLSDTRTAVWIHASDGSTVGRFGRMGIDLHNTVTEQMSGKPECRLCTHGQSTAHDWALFREKAKEWWGVEVPDDAFDKCLLLAS
jgi:hypothetical protein